MRQSKLLLLSFCGAFVVGICVASAQVRLMISPQNLPAVPAEPSTAVARKLLGSVKDHDHDHSEHNHDHASPVAEHADGEHDHDHDHADDEHNHDHADGDHDHDHDHDNADGEHNLDHDHGDGEHDHDHDHDHGDGEHDHDHDHADGEHDHDHDHADGEHDHDHDHADGEHDHDHDHADGEHDHDHDHDHADDDHDHDHDHGHDHDHDHDHDAGKDESDDSIIQVSPNMDHPCYQDPSAAECASFRRAHDDVIADRASLCAAMDFMVGCTFMHTCSAENTTADVESPYCKPWSQVGALCIDMPRMKGCEAWNALCGTEVVDTTVVDMCNNPPPVPNVITTMEAMDAINAICSAEPGLDGCATCDFERSGLGICSDFLTSLSLICQEVPDDENCAGLERMCAGEGVAETFPDLCPMA